MIYCISIKQSALKALKSVERADRIRIIDAIDQLKNNPAAGSVLKGEYSGLRRIRVGSYRVVYEIHEEKLTILVIRIGHRREVYR